MAIVIERDHAAVVVEFQQQRVGLHDAAIFIRAGHAGEPQLWDHGAIDDHLLGRRGGGGAAFQRGWLEPERAMLESLLSIRRAGADFIVTYFAKDAAKVLA